MRAVEITGGLRLAVQQRGAGVPVVLLHAWGETHRSFDRLLPLLPADWHVVVPDQRGVGQSAKPTHGYRLVDAASDVSGMLDALNIPAAWLVGSSSGAYVAQQLAVASPNRVLGLVLIGAPRSLARRDPFGEILEAFHDPVVAEDIEALNQGLDLPSVIPYEFLAAQTAAALTIPHHVWLAGYRGLIEAAPPIETGVIQAPTLLINGADDHLFGPADAAGLAAAIPRSRLHLYRSTGHFVLWERPEWVARDVVRFINDPGGAELD